MLCGLRSNAAEFLGVNGDLYRITELGTLGDLLSGINIYLKRRILNLLNSDLVDVHLDALSALIQQYFYIICALGIIAAKSSLHSLLYFIVHIILGYSLFFFKILNCGKEFCIHFNIPLFYLYGHVQFYLRDLLFLQEHRRNGHIAVLVGFKAAYIALFPLIGLIKLHFDL